MRHGNFPIPIVDAGRTGVFGIIWASARVGIARALGPFILFPFVFAWRAFCLCVFWLGAFAAYGYLQTGTVQGGLGFMGDTVADIAHDLRHDYGPERAHRETVRQQVLAGHAQIQPELAEYPSRYTSQITASLNQIDGEWYAMTDQQRAQTTWPDYYQQRKADVQQRWQWEKAVHKSKGGFR